MTRQLINSNFWQIANADANGNILQVTLPSNANIRIGGGANNQVLATDGSGNLSWVPQTGGNGGGNATPGGSNTQVQFNDNGVFGGSNAFTFNKVSNTLLAETVIGETASFVEGDFANIEVDTYANLGQVANVKIYGGSQNYYLRTDGAGNLQWAPTLTGTVTQVGGNGSGLGFALTGNVTSNGNLTLTTPDVANLRQTLNIKDVANIQTDSNTQHWLRGDGVWANIAVDPLANIVVDNTIVPAANGNYYFSDGNALFNNINWTVANGNIQAHIDYNTRVEINNSVQMNQLEIIDQSGAYTVAFKNTNFIAENQIYDFPNSFPTSNYQVLMAGRAINGESQMFWANSAASNLVPYIKFNVSSNGNGQFFFDANLANYANSNDMAVFYNGGLVTNGDYSLSGNVLTMNVYMNNGDLVEVIRQGGSFTIANGGNTASGVIQIIAGNNITVSPANGIGVVTINANIPITYSNANVANYLPTYTGNVSANYFLGNGALLTGLPITYSNANVANYLPTYTGNMTFSNANIIITGGSNGQVLTTNGTGNLSWTTPSGGGGGSSISNGNSNVSVALNSNVTMSINAVNSFTLSNNSVFINDRAGANLTVVASNLIAIGVGSLSNSSNVGSNIIAIGRLAGNGLNLSSNVIAIGANAFYSPNSGYSSRVSNSIGIGFNIRATGAFYPMENVIVLNANASGFNNPEFNSNAFYVNPIRNGSTSNLLCYDPNTKEITYSNALSISSITSTANTTATVGNIVNVVINGITYQLLAR